VDATNLSRPHIGISQIMAFDIRLKPNFKLFLTGPSGCGKTSLISSILANLNQITHENPTKVIYYYKQWQSKFDELRDYGLVHEFTKETDNILSHLKEQAKYYKLFVIFDDLLNSENLAQIADLFTVDARHLKISSAFLTQRMFVNNEYFRQISQNSDYFCIFKNPRNSAEIRTLAGQLTPGSLDLLKIYQQATIEPYSYLFINLTQECDMKIKYLSNIFKNDHAIKAFVPSNCDT